MTASASPSLDALRAVLPATRDEIRHRLPQAYPLTTPANRDDLTRHLAELGAMPDGRDVYRLPDPPPAMPVAAVPERKRRVPTRLCAGSCGRGLRSDSTGNLCSKCRVRQKATSPPAQPSVATSNVITESLVHVLTSMPLEELAELISFATSTFSGRLEVSHPEAARLMRRAGLS